MWKFYKYSSVLIKGSTYLSVCLILFYYRSCFIRTYTWEGIVKCYLFVDCCHML